MQNVFQQIIVTCGESYWSQPDFMCLKSTIETLEEVVKSAQIQQ